ncbi:MAG: hypothetical protein JRH18_08935 [Deltaproteobacteria bacterium]|nr:hypothetical protein [Deltaproteobacteria bacterium]MBW2151778.1 hypothetical protein [Deltaproteobacteria bacterium]
MKTIIKEKLTERQYLEHGEAIKYRTDGRRVPWEAKWRRSFLNWIYRAMASNKTSRAKDTKIKMNLTKKKYLIPILEYLTDNHLDYFRCVQTVRKIGISKIKMEVMRDKKRVNKWRFPILIRLDAKAIAGHLGISPVYVYKYLKAMEKCGLLMYAKKRDSVQSPASFLILGGWFVREEGHYSSIEDEYSAIEDEYFATVRVRIETPAYFWGASRPGIKDILANFALR